MFKVVTRLAIFAILTLGFVAAFPQLSISKSAQASETCLKDVTGKCAKLTNNYSNPGFKCPAPRIGGMSGILDSRYRKSSPYPGCADKVLIKVKKGACYKITINGIIDYNCDAKLKADHVLTDPFFRLDSKKRGAPIKFNGVSIRSFSTEAGKTYNNCHCYSFNWKADRDTIQMYIIDSNYLDNKGSFSYKIEEVDCETCPDLQ